MIYHIELLYKKVIWNFMKQVVAGGDFFWIAHMIPCRKTLQNMQSNHFCKIICLNPTLNKLCRGYIYLAAGGTDWKRPAKCEKTQSARLYVCIDRGLEISNKNHDICWKSQKNNWAYFHDINTQQFWLYCHKFLRKWT